MWGKTKGTLSQTCQWSNTCFNLRIHLPHSLSLGINRSVCVAGNRPSIDLISKPWWGTRLSIVMLASLLFRIMRVLSQTPAQCKHSGPRVSFCIRLLNSSVWRIHYTKHELSCVGKPLRWCMSWVTSLQGHRWGIAVGTQQTVWKNASMTVMRNEAQKI